VVSSIALILLCHDGCFVFFLVMLRVELMTTRTAGIDTATSHLTRFNIT